LTIGPVNALSVFERAGLNLVLATGVVGVVEASTIKKVETGEVTVFVRSLPAFFGIEGRDASGRTDQNTVYSIRFQRRPMAVRTAIQPNVLLSVVDIAVDLVATYV